MPLGPELAAAWTTILPVADIAAGIERSADFLASEWRDVPERQQGMRAVFDWSWRLLTDREQQVLRQLALFRGGFTREAAHEVAGATLGLLMGLLRKSLVHRIQGTYGTVRYDIHGLLRQYAAEHLDATPDEREETHRRHSVFYLALAERASTELTGPQRVEWLERMERDHGNITSAHAWLAERHEVETEIRFAGAVAYFWFVRAYHIQGHERVLHLLNQAPTPARARVLNAAGYSEWVVGNLDEARAQGDPVRARAAFNESAMHLYKTENSVCCHIRRGAWATWHGRTAKGTEPTPNIGKARCSIVMSGTAGALPRPWLVWLP